jgi:hypothetical protein
VTEQGSRPFYSEYAWAFDLIIDRPVRKECAAMVAWLIERDVLPGSSLLDAGCGSGRYSVELARRAGPHAPAGTRRHPGQSDGPQAGGGADRSRTRWGPPPVSSPSSPDFNPIELAFAKLKAFLRGARPRSFDQVLACSSTLLGF